MRKQHQHVIDILEGLRIPFDRVDISDPANEKERKFMQANSDGGKKGATPLPPQIFHNDEYCGVSAFLYCDEQWLHFCHCFCTFVVVVGDR